MYFSLTALIGLIGFLLVAMVLVPLFNADRKIVAIPFWNAFFAASLSPLLLCLNSW